jgi:ankyrin repeat protein
MDLQVEPNPVLGRTAKTLSTALHFAIMGLGEPNKDNTEVIHLLLEAKANLFAQKENKDTPLCLLAKTADDLDIADLLIQKMIEIDPKQTVPKILKCHGV